MEEKIICRKGNGKRESFWERNFPPTLWSCLLTLSKGGGEHEKDKMGSDWKPPHGSGYLVLAGKFKIMAGNPVEGDAAMLHRLADPYL
jgi:hypothetical protein